MSLFLWTINNQWNNQYLLIDYLRFNRYLLTKEPQGCHIAQLQGHSHTVHCEDGAPWNYLGHIQPAGWDIAALQWPLSSATLESIQVRGGSRQGWKQIEIHETTVAREKWVKKIKVAYAKDMEMQFLSFSSLGGNEQILK